METENKKILSIIIPTYNAANFLDKGLSTYVMMAQNQKFNEKVYEAAKEDRLSEVDADMDMMNKLEVLIVNDGTKDDSVEVAQKFVDRFPGTFKIINKQNGGHGSAINTGVEHATAKYFKCVDADDWVYTDALARTIQILEKEDFDALIQSFITYDISKDLWEPRDIHCEKSDRLYNLKEIVDMWEALDYGMSFHGITYNTSFYKKLRYKLIEGVFYEDQEYATIPLSYAEKVRLLDDELYVYRLGDVNQSVSTQSQLARLPHFEAVLFKMLEHEKNLDELPEGGREMWTRKISMFLGSLFHILFIKNPDKKSQRKYAKQLMNRIKAKSPYIYSQSKNKYRGFVILNRMHMNEKTYETKFATFLDFLRRKFRVHRLYG